MRRQITIYNPRVPLTEEDKSASAAFNFWIKQVTEGGLLIGDGTPVGNVEAQQGVMYMDESGIAGAILFIKQQAEVAGDKTQGWVAVG